MSVPEPVMSLAVSPRSREAAANFGKGLNRFTKEDPTFRVRCVCVLCVCVGRISVVAAGRTRAQCCHHDRYARHRPG